MCSSDLPVVGAVVGHEVERIGAQALGRGKHRERLRGDLQAGEAAVGAHPESAVVVSEDRSEERRVGKECRSRWSPYH